MRTAGLHQRYKITPQMLQYDKLRQFLTPYLNHTNEPNVKSEVLNTDKYGTRKSVYANTFIDRENFSNHGIVFLGGSACMGWGSTSDKTTIPSYTAKLLDKPCLNLGVMAGNSEMEVIAALPYTNQKNYFVSITGHNTLCNQLFKELTGLSFWGDIYEAMMPFNEEVWAAIYSHDVLFNSYIIRNDINPLSYFKVKSDKGRFNRAARIRCIERLKNKIGLKKAKSINLEGFSLHAERVAQQAADIQLKNMINLNKLSDGKCLYIIQPYLLSDDRKLAEEEKLLYDEHYEFTSSLARVLLYEWMPKVFRNFCDIVIKKSRGFGFDIIDLTHPPEDIWFFSDTVHLTDYGNDFTAQQIMGRLSCKF